MLNSSYGPLRRLVQWAFLLFFAATPLMPACAAETGQIVAFGDSLSAGYLLPEKDAFPARLEQALKGLGYTISVVNAGVSGDTASDGAERVDWSVADGTRLVVLELGANDMLRGLDPALTRAALARILARLATRNIPVLLCGMKAAPNLGPDYAAKFEAIYPELAAQFHVPLYPFFLEGMARDPALTLSDGMHPNPAGVDEIVRHILPSIVPLLPKP